MKRFAIVQAGTDDRVWDVLHHVSGVRPPLLLVQRLDNSDEPPRAEPDRRRAASRVLIQQCFKHAIPAINTEEPVNAGTARARATKGRTK